MAKYPDRRYDEFGRIQIDFRGNEGFLVLLDADDAGHDGRVLDRATNYQDAARLALHYARYLKQQSSTNAGELRERE